MTPHYQTLLIAIHSREDFHLRNLISSYVSAQFHCTHVDQLAEALCLLQEQKTHLILLVLGFPDDSALDTICSIRLAAPGIPIVLLAEVEDQTSIAAAAQIGIEDSLGKNRPRSDLLSQVLVQTIEHDNSQDSLEFSELQILQETIDTMAANIAILDHNGDVQAVNHAWRSFAGKNGASLKEGVIRSTGYVAGWPLKDYTPSSDKK